MCFNGLHFRARVLCSKFENSVQSLGLHKACTKGAEECIYTGLSFPNSLFVSFFFSQWDFCTKYLSQPQMQIVLSSFSIFHLQYITFFRLRPLIFKWFAIVFAMKSICSEYHSLIYCSIYSIPGLQISMFDFLNKNKLFWVSCLYFPNVQLHRPVVFGCLLFVQLVPLFRGEVSLQHIALALTKRLISPFVQLAMEPIILFWKCIQRMHIYS